MSVNVVVVVWDTVRGAETVPADESLTPALASLAARGTEYSNAFTVAPWTVPAHGSLFTGTYPSRHGAHADSAFLDGRLPTLAEVFRDAGYETMAVSNNQWIAEEFGFARGFEAFREQAGRGTTDRRLRDGLTGVASATPTEWTLDPDSVGGSGARLRAGLRPGPRDDGADRTVRRVRRWLRRRSEDDPFFLFVNLVDAHLEYRPPRRFAGRHLPDGWSHEAATALPQDPRAFDAGRFAPTDEEWSVLHALYRGEIAYLDAQLARLRAALEETGAAGETLLVVTSDHGENVGEHGLLGHQYSVADTVLSVPLVVAGPGFDGADGHDGLVQLVDLAPTLLDAAGVDAPAAREGFQGRSFHPAAGGPRRRRAFAEYRGPRPPVERLEERFGEVPDRIHGLQRSLRAVRTRRHKYVRGSDGSASLYDVAADPGEADDRLGAAPERAAALEAALDDWLSSFDHADADEAAAISPSTERHLANLGYM